jgi:hypothetical protein
MGRNLVFTLWVSGFSQGKDDFTSDTQFSSGSAQGLTMRKTGAFFGTVPVISLSESRIFVQVDGSST